MKFATIETNGRNGRNRIILSKFLTLFCKKLQSVDKNTWLKEWCLCSELLASTCMEFNERGLDGTALHQWSLLRQKPCQNLRLMDTLGENVDKKSGFKNSFTKLPELAGNKQKLFIFGFFDTLLCKLQLVHLKLCRYDKKNWYLSLGYEMHT